MRKLVLLTVILAPWFSNAEIVAEYLFDQSLTNSAGSGYALSAVGGSGIYNQYTVFGTTKYALDLSDSQGLTVDTTGFANPAIYTVIMDVKSPEVVSYNKLFSPDGGVEDAGLYLNQSNAVWYPDLRPTENNVESDTWVRIALVRSATEEHLYAGVAGSMIDLGYISSVSGTQLSSLPLFFKDDAATNGGENYSLTVSGLWISNTAMNQAEIASLQVIPEPASLLSLFMGIAVFGTIRWFYKQS